MYLTQVSDPVLVAGRRRGAGQRLRRPLQSPEDVGQKVRLQDLHRLGGAVQWILVLIDTG